MSMIMNLHKYSFYQRIAALLTLCALAGCEAFLVSICVFEDRATCSTSSPDVGENPDLAGPVFNETHFSLRASCPLGVSRKYNGIIDGKMLTMGRNIQLTNPIFWENWMLDLNNPELTNRLLKTSPNGAPNIPVDFDFNKDNIYTSGLEFYFLQYRTNYLYKAKNGIFGSAIGRKLLSNFQPKIFAHPLFDGFSVAVQPVVPGTNLTLAVRDMSEFFVSTKAAPTSFTIGNIDSNDLVNNGEEIIIFDGEGPQKIVHLNGAILEDDVLLVPLRMSVARTRTGNENLIEAAFVANLNKDDFPDFIYSRSGKIYVTSYLGRDKNIDSRFKDWSANIAVVVDQNVKSLVAVDLTGDGYPELVVETDKAVLFYVNSSK